MNEEHGFVEVNDLQIGIWTKHTSSSSGETYEQIEIATWKIFVVLLPTIIITLLVLIGNILVIVAISTQRALKTMSNIYILSLAIADLLVGIIVLPFAITKVFLGTWIFGKAFCHFWLTTDIAFCTVSIYHLCVIALDRYRCVVEGVSYMQGRSIQSVSFVVLTIWGLSFWISSPPLLGWNSWTKNNANTCELSTDNGYVVHSAFGSLIFPLIIMLYLYGKTYQEIQRRLEDKRRIHTMMEPSADFDLCTEKLDETSSSMSSVVNARGELGQLQTRSIVSIQSEQIRTMVKEKVRISLTRERKAAKTLGIIIIAFIGCWFPFGIAYSLSPFLPLNLKPSDTITYILTWLGYFNSAVNPVIYTIFSPDFRKGFKRLLRIKTR